MIPVTSLELGIVVNLIGMTIPIMIMAALLGVKGTSVTLILDGVVTLMILLLWDSSSSVEASSLQITPSGEAPRPIETSSLTSAEAELWASSVTSAKVSVVRSSASALSSIPWVCWAVLPEVCALMSSAWFISLLVFSFLFVFF